jgi:hypothetical protein
MFRHRRTSESNVGPPLIPLNELVARRPSAGGSHSREAESVAADGAGVQTCYRRVCLFTPGYWSSSNPALTISLRCRGAAPYTSSERSPLCRHALVPSAFRLQVSRLTSKSSPPNFAQLRWEFLRCVTRRTISRQPSSTSRHRASRLGSPLGRAGEARLAGWSRPIPPRQ